MKQLPPGQRAQYVTFTNPKEVLVLNWGWMHRARFLRSDNELGIVFPGLVVVVKGANLAGLVDGIAIGEVTHVSQVKLTEKESQDKGHHYVSSVEFSNPEED